MCAKEWPALTTGNGISIQMQHDWNRCFHVDRDDEMPSEQKLHESHMFLSAWTLHRALWSSPFHQHFNLVRKLWAMLRIKAWHSVEWPFCWRLRLIQNWAEATVQLLELSRDEAEMRWSTAWLLSAWSPCISPRQQGKPIFLFDSSQCA